MVRGGEGRGGRAGEGGPGRSRPWNRARVSAVPRAGLGGGALCGPEERVAVLISRPPAPRSPYRTRGGRIWMPRASPAAELGRTAVVGREVPGAEPSSHLEFCRFAAEDLEQTVSKELAYSLKGSLRAATLLLLQRTAALSVQILSLKQKYV